MRKRHPKNERIKREYLVWLEGAKQLSPHSADQALAAIVLFEESTGYRDFAVFRIEQAMRFKRVLVEAVIPATGKRLAKATIHSRLIAAKAFFRWLASQPGYRRIRYPDADYFNPSANDSRIATARRERPAPQLSQVHGVIDAMPDGTAIENRDRALIALAILTGARGNALASFCLHHVDLDQQMVFQDAREVRTKYRKSFTTWFFPIGGNAETIVRKWIRYLKHECGCGPDDPLFPQTRTGLDAEGLFVPDGLTRKHWSDAGAIRKIFRQAFAAAGLPYFHPHSFRTTLGLFGLTVCRTEEEWSAWSLNLGHENVATTFKSYATVPMHRRAEIMRSLGEGRPGEGTEAGDIAALERLLSGIRQRTIAPPVG